MKLLFISVLAVSLLTACTGSKKETTPEEKNNVVTEQNEDKPEQESIAIGEGSGKVDYLNTQNFVANVFDFRTEQEWNYKGSMPAVIDFYADWCGPCKRVAPIMNELAAEYKGKIQFYKVNTDLEQEVANAFGIQSIPSILIIPMKGKAQMSQGALPKTEYIRMINEVIFATK